ncbi:hypothetical protein HJG60_010537 [Phyllostomus discolor]|uniref:Uncharacterized protein n=1 Tax=Phyllostomus discolor TaxID=89673 RepID=A0A834ANB9_9CHIR|nr:hypothetical protein HJG60_010537 [Phyllostomus discolor]
MRWSKKGHSEKTSYTLEKPTREGLLKAVRYRLRAVDQKQGLQARVVPVCAVAVNNQACYWPKLISGGEVIEDLHSGDAVRGQCCQELRQIQQNPQQHTKLGGPKNTLVSNKNKDKVVSMHLSRKVNIPGHLGKEDR